MAAFLASLLIFVFCLSIPMAFIGLMVFCVYKVYQRGFQTVDRAIDVFAPLAAERYIKVNDALDAFTDVAEAKVIDFKRIAADQQIPLPPVRSTVLRQRSQGKTSHLPPPQDADE